MGMLGSVVLAASALAVEFAGENAVFSPRGDEVALEVEVGGDQPRIAVCDAASGAPKFQVCEEGACHPAWRADGEALVFTCRYWQRGTAKAANSTDDGWNLCVWERGRGCRRLTRGRFHDAMPSFSPDGQFVYFVSTRESPSESRTSLFRVPADGTGQPERVGRIPLADIAWTGQPVVSPDGRHLVWAQMDSAKDIWHLRAAKLSTPEDNLIITEALESAFEPRFSPDGRYLAYTGYRLGDDGWGVYLQDFRTGATRRIAKGRCCDFRPDGRALLISRDGRTWVQELAAADFPAQGEVRPRQYPDEKLVWRAEKLAGPVKIPVDSRFEFGNDEVVFVRARVRVPPADRSPCTVFRGGYGGTVHAFELWFGKGFLELAMHDESDQYLSVRGPRPTAGQVVEIVALRSPESNLIYVDGREIVSIIQSRGIFPFARPFDFNAGEGFGPGEIEKVEFGRGWPKGTPPPRARREVLQ